MSTTGATLLREMLDALDGDPELCERVRRLLVARSDSSPPEWVRLRSCGLPVTSVRQAIKAGELAASKIGRELVVRRADLDAWAASKQPTRRPEPPAPKPDAFQRAIDAGRLRVVRGAKGGK